jgi:hypothetical protein
VERVLGSQAAAALLIFGVAHASKQDALETLPPIETLGKTERAALPEAVIRVIELARDMQSVQPIPGDWLAEVSRQFPHSSQSLNVGQLHALAEAGLDAERFELAYAVSAAGLERGGPTQAGFLLLRARSLPKYGDGRWAVCAAAAAELARRERHMDVVEKAVELLAESPFEDLTLTPEQVSTVLQKEKAERAFPTAYRPGPDYSDFFGEDLCMCPECRHARGEADGDDGVDAIFGGTEIPPDLPPDLAKILFEETRKSVQRGESIDSLMNRLFGPGMGFGGRRKKGRRR